MKGLLFATLVLLVAVFSKIETATTSTLPKSDGFVEPVFMVTASVETKLLISPVILAARRFLAARKFLEWCAWPAILGPLACLILEWLERRERLTVLSLRNHASDKRVIPPGSGIAA